MPSPATPHAVQRYQERYGRILTDADAHKIVADLLAGRGIMLARQFGGAERWYVQVHGQAAHVVWYPATRVLVTFLPKFRNRSRPVHKALPSKFRTEDMHPE